MSDDAPAFALSKMSRDGTAKRVELVSFVFGAPLVVTIIGPAVELSQDTIKTIFADLYANDDHYAGLIAPQENPNG